MKKQGLSAVVTTVLLIALTLAVVGIVWGVVSGLVNQKLKSTGSCSDTFDKVTINGLYTCYNSATNKANISVSVGDISLDGVLISVSGRGTSTSFTVKNDSQTISNVAMYSGSPTILLPAKNSGLTYIYNLSGAGFSGSPDKIEIAPIVNGNQCGVSDSVTEIPSCSSLVS